MYARKLSTRKGKRNLTRLQRESFIIITGIVLGGLALYPTIFHSFFLRLSSCFCSPLAAAYLATQKEKKISQKLDLLGPFIYYNLACFFLIDWITLGSLLSLSTSVLVTHGYIYFLLLFVKFIYFFAPLAFTTFTRT